MPRAEPGEVAGSSASAKQVPGDHRDGPTVCSKDHARARVIHVMCSAIWNLGQQIIHPRLDDGLGCRDFRTAVEGFFQLG